MANEKHLYLTVGGGYISSASALANETWQFGVRLALVFGAIDEVGTLPNNWDPYADTHNDDEADWTIAGNWSVEGPLSNTFDPAVYLNDAAGPAAQNFIESANFSLAVQLRELRLYPIGPTGHAVPAPPYAAGSPVVLTYKSTQPVGGSSGTTPLQDTAVMSLRTQQVGRRGRGRCYLPMSGAGNVGSAALQGLMSSAYQTQLIASCKGFLEDLAVTAALPNTPQVMPIVTGAPWVNYGRVTQVVVDNAWDTQRRRRKSVITTALTETLDIG